MSPQPTHLSFIYSIPISTPANIAPSQSLDLCTAGMQKKRMHLGKVSSHAFRSRLEAMQVRNSRVLGIWIMPMEMQEIKVKHSLQDDTFMAYQTLCPGGRGVYWEGPKRYLLTYRFRAEATVAQV